MKKLAKTTAMLLMLLFMTSATADMPFEDWDTNDSGLITRSEFVAHFTDNYVADWNNYDDNATFDDEDFYTVTYDIWDVDDDDLLTVEEWDYGYDYFYGDYVNDDFVALDLDNDGFIEYVEYYDVFADTYYYTDWDIDADTYLNEYELARLVFNNWDVDNSNFIEKDEFDDFKAYYLEV